MNGQKKFLKYDTDINAKARGVSPLFWAIYGRKPIKVIQLLLDKGADPHFIDSDGSTALIDASIPNRWTGVSSIDPQVITAVT